MWRRTLLMVLATVVVLGIVGQVLAQPRPGGQNPGGQNPGDRPGSRSPEEMRARMEEYRTRMADRQREQVGATEDEWKILQPRMEKVQQLQRQISGYGGSGGFSSRFGRGPGGDSTRQPEGAPERERSDVEIKTEALRTVLADEDAPASAIKAALEALRVARKRAEEELSAARRDLRDVCSPLQEAQFVLMRILD